MKRIRIALFAALVLVVAGLAALDVLDPGVGILEQPLSAHGRGPNAALWVVTVILAGVAMIGEATIWSRRSVAKAGPRLLALSGVAMITLAIFTTDPWYPWQHSLTPMGWVHVIATGAAMGGLFLSMLTTFARHERHERVATGRLSLGLAAGYSMLLAMVLVVTLVLVVLGRPVPLIGIEERVLLFLAVSWLTVRLAASAP